MQLIIVSDTGDGAADFDKVATILIKIPAEPGLELHVVLSMSDLTRPCQCHFLGVVDAGVFKSLFN